MAPRHDQALLETPVQIRAQIPSSRGTEVREAEVDEGDQVGAVGGYFLYVSGPWCDKVGLIRLTDG